MLIMTQASDRIINLDQVISIYVTTLTGYAIGVEFVNGDKSTIGYYREKADCLVVLRLIFDAIDRKESTFELPHIDEVYSVRPDIAE